MSDDKWLLEAMRNNPDLAMENRDLWQTKRSGPPDTGGAAPVPSLPQADTWTQTERQFALGHLEPRLEPDGDLVYYHAQHEMRLMGHKYTADFFCLRRDGGIELWEIKGKAALGSQGRSSSNFRWTLSQLHDIPNASFYWAKLQDDGTFKITRKRSVRPKNPIARP